jgi:hypothetical protein
VFANHKNFIFDELRTQRVLFAVARNYIEGPWNNLVDNLSRLHHLPMPSQIAEGKKLIEPTLVSDDKDDKEAFLMDCSYSGMLDEDINAILECYLNLPEMPDPTANPLSYADIYKHNSKMNNFWLYK